MAPIYVLGGGLAGCEAAWQITRAGHRSVLVEMRPVRSTSAHKTGQLAELVCSNSLKSESPGTAPWLLKEELRRLDSLLLGAAQKARVPGGHALTVDREVFARQVSAAIAENPLIELRRRRGNLDRRGCHHHRRDRPSNQCGPGRGDRPHHRRRAALLLRLHQSHRRRRLRRLDYRLPRLPLRQIARRKRRLSQLSVRPRPVRALRGRGARGRSGDGPHPRRPDTVL